MVIRVVPAQCRHIRRNTRALPRFVLHVVQAEYPANAAFTAGIIEVAEHLFVRTTRYDGLKRVIAIIMASEERLT